MKRLKDFTGDEAFAVVNKLLPPCFTVATSEKVSALKKKGCTLLDYIRCTLAEEPTAMKEIIATLSESEDYTPNAAELYNDVLELITDEDMIELFGFQGRRKTGASSGSASKAGKKAG